MSKKLFLLDGMALVYRAHFALIARPIFTSKGVNTSALFGFTQTLLEIMKTQQPTHLAVAFDTAAPTQRHLDFPEYKATRQAMPEDLSRALPEVRRLLEALRVPALECDGYEADDLIATMARLAERRGFDCYMVSSDKDFGQLISEHVFLYKPGRMGDRSEILGLPEIRRRWGIQHPEQVVDILALMGDASDNIPGVPGIGEKTASKLVAQFGSVENLLARTGELTGRVRQNLEQHREAALLSKRLATLNCEVPCAWTPEALAVRPWDEDRLKALMVEFEFNSIGRRLFGEDFKAGHGFAPASARPVARTTPHPASPASAPAHLLKLADEPHEYTTAASAGERARAVAQLQPAERLGFDLAWSGHDPKSGRILGFAFSPKERVAVYFPAPPADPEFQAFLEELRPLLESPGEKAGHDLKPDLVVLQRHGLRLGGALFDAMVAHSLVEPDVRHTLAYLSESLLGHTPIDLAQLAAGEARAGGIDLRDVPPARAAEFSAERADLALRLRARLRAPLDEKRQEQVFYSIEAPLLPVLAGMEAEGIRVEAPALAEFARQLGAELEEQEQAIRRLAGQPFNLNSPRQLGQILFETLKISAAPKKTRTGQYATDEQTLAALAPDHEIVRRLLEHRAAAKLKSTYADALPAAIFPATGRVHTTFNQVATSTGRLNSQDPNLQNIPIRTERGQEIRRAFVPRGPDFLLLSADYSQIELRIIAALSREPGLLEAFRAGLDVHAATAARVFGVFLELVTPEMRRKAKMVNYGIAYGISAFGLAQRLAIPRREAAEIIDNYFQQFAGIRQYMDQTIRFAREHGYVATVTGRRRYLRDINSSNAAVRAAAERNAINAPIQGTAADMIKIAMVNIYRELEARKLKTRLLLQVHDELLFDLFRPEEAEVRALVEDRMKTAIPLEAPIVVEVGVGENWLEAH